MCAVGVISVGTALASCLSMPTALEFYALLATNTVFLNKQDTIAYRNWRAKQKRNTESEEENLNGHPKQVAW